MNFKKLFKATALAAALAMSVGSAAAEELNLKMGFVDPANSSYAMGGQKFADECARLTDGKVKVQVIAGGTLGGERDMQIFLEHIQNILAGAFEIYNAADEGAQPGQYL